MIDHKAPGRDRHNKRIQLRHRTDIKDIEKEIIKGNPYTSIANKYGIENASITKYKKKYLSKKVNTYNLNRDIQDSKEIWDTINEYIGHTNAVARSCRNFLSDPDNTDNIDVAPQSTDIRVTYYKTIDDKRAKHKDTLQNIIDTLDGIEVSKIEINTPDRVKTLLEASHVMNKQLHLVSSIQGMIGNTTINIANQPMFVAFVQAVVRSLEPYPEAKQALITEVRQLSTAPLLDVEPKSVLGRGNK